jgi:DNA-binding cell septation regulator SpoVG
MNVRVKLIQSATKPHRIADTSVELTDANGDSLVISDIRILRNRQGQLWVAMPSRSVNDGSRSFQYLPQVELGRNLQRMVEDAVLDEYERWRNSALATEVR